MPDMSERCLELCDGPVAFAGAISLEVDNKGVKPWRLPYPEQDLTVPHTPAHPPGGLGAIVNEGVEDTHFSAGLRRFCSVSA